MPNGVTCAVNSCTFWERGNSCNAKEIHIQTDYAALLRELKNEFSSEIHVQEREVRHPIDTCCHTYSPRDECDE